MEPANGAIAVIAFDHLSITCLSADAIGFFLVLGLLEVSIIEFGGWSVDIVHHHIIIVMIVLIRCYREGRRAYSLVSFDSSLGLFLLRFIDASLLFFAELQRIEQSLTQPCTYDLKILHEAVQDFSFIHTDLIEMTRREKDKQHD